MPQKRQARLPAQDKQTIQDFHFPGLPIRQGHNDKGPPCGEPLKYAGAGSLLARKAGKPDDGTRFTVLTEKGSVIAS
jgi:hypothetical protein